MPDRFKYVLKLLSLSAGAALLVAVAITVFEWLRNSGNVFRSAKGTEWLAVYETLASWFWPTFIGVTIIVAIVRLCRVALQGR